MKSINSKAVFSVLGNLGDFLFITENVICFITYSKWKTPLRPGPKKASNIEKDPVGVSQSFFFKLTLSSHTRTDTGKSRIHAFHDMY